MSPEWVKVDPLPHRPPFLFVDRVLWRSPGQSLIALKSVSLDERLLGGRPTLAPILLLECLAQAAGLLAGDEEAGVGVLAAVPRFHVCGEVRVGDLLEIRVQVKRKLGKLLMAAGEVLVGENKVASAELVLSLGAVAH